MNWNQIPAPCDLAPTSQIATLDQGRKALDPALTLKEALTGGGSDTLKINGEPKHVVGYMKDFLFTPEQARTTVEKLSGGERGRLALARALALPSNLLVLDEPTNDLDLETLDLLEEMLGDYQGTVHGRQPRPRFSRPRRDLGSGGGGRGALD